jgi:hypothetical protein
VRIIWKFFNIITVLAMSEASCAELPPLRSQDEFPRDRVMARIECELVNGINAATASQAGPTFATLHQLFDIPKYTASLVLHDESQGESGALIGGLRKFSNNPKYRQVKLGSGDIPGLGATATNMQYIEATRSVAFSDVKKEPAPGKNTYTDNNDGLLVKQCKANSASVSQTGVGSLGMDRPLGIAVKLAAINDELAVAPAVVSTQKLHFEFNVVLSAGGTLSFTEPLNGLDLGAGASQTWKESLDIVVTLSSPDKGS